MYICELFGEAREKSECQYNERSVVGCAMGPNGIKDSIIPILEQPYHQQTYDRELDTSSQKVFFVFWFVL